jgi:Endonuclease-reverse transcriptase
LWATRDTQCIAHITPAAAIVVLNKNYRVVTINSLTTSHAVVVALHTVDGPLYLVSMYFQYRDPVDLYLNQLREIMRHLRGKRVMVGIEANARSSMWQSDRTCGRGSGLEDFILEQGLLVINKRSPFPTFSSSSGDSNIDVSLVTASLWRSCIGWRVAPDLVVMNHSLLLKEVALSGVAPVGGGSEWRYLVNGANWETFLPPLKESSNPHPNPMTWILRQLCSLRQYP